MDGIDDKLTACDCSWVCPVACFFLSARDVRAVLTRWLID